MNIEALVASMTPEIYERLRQAVETGKWPDGTPLNDEQKASSMQAVMLYQSKIERSSEHMTVGESGEIVHKSKADFKRSLRDEQEDKNTIARFKQDDI
ncbi:YeaC family protein [Alteromonas sp. S005]|uniref:YeaC family protein n=1 Tax=Alteromonas sp. S005 TaxID=3117400 RepID=UPI002FE13C82